MINANNCLKISPRPSDIDHMYWLENAGIVSFANKSVLDLGCGSGYINKKAFDDGASKSYGVDIVTPDFSEPPLWNFSQLDLEKSDWDAEIGEKFNIILAFDIIEHLDSPFQFLETCQRLLENGGKLILTTPNVLSWERFYRPDSWSGIKDPQHKTLFTKYSLKFILNRAGYSSTKITAPLRSLSFLGTLQPCIGGQILCIAEI